jgi:hypothetical protein
MQFGVYLTADQRKRLAAVMAREQTRIRRWKKPRRERLAKIKSPIQRGIRRAKYKDEFKALCDARKFITRRDILIEPFVVVGLDERGWHGPYEPLPPAARGPGRRYGSTNVVPRLPDEPYAGPATRRIGVVLSDKVGNRLESACYHEQIDLINQLEAFYEVYGDSPHLPDPRPGETPDALAKRYRDELRAEIVTTGDILRFAVDRVIADPGAARARAVAFKSYDLT